jgi:hypothetical protein
MTHAFMSVGDVQIATRVLVWAENHLMSKHSAMNRPYGTQVVCPFVKASAENNSIYMVFHHEFDGGDPASIANKIMAYVEPFKAAAPSAEMDQLLKCLLIVFPKVKKAYFNTLDVCHQITKSPMVTAGLMVGQFHPKCEEPAIHNHDWRAVAKAPVALMAVRHMTYHDIMFLTGREEWFRAYELRFGERWLKACNRPSPIDRHLRGYYELAKRKYQRGETRPEHQPRPLLREPLDATRN